MSDERADRVERGARRAIENWKVGRDDFSELLIALEEEPVSDMRLRKIDAGLYVLEPACRGCDQRGEEVRQQPNGDLVCTRCGRITSLAVPEELR